MRDSYKPLKLLTQRSAGPRRSGTFGWCGGSVDRGSFCCKFSRPGQCRAQFFCRKSSLLLIATAPESRFGQRSDHVICFIGDVQWHVDPVTGRHWRAADSDAEMSEAEVEVQVSGEVTAPGTVETDTEETEGLETDDDPLAAAREVIRAEVRRTFCLKKSSDCRFQEFSASDRHSNPLVSAGSHPHTAPSEAGERPVMHSWDENQLVGDPAFWGGGASLAATGPTHPTAGPSPNPASHRRSTTPHPPSGARLNIAGGGVTPTPESRDTTPRASSRQRGKTRVVYSDEEGTTNEIGEGSGQRPTPRPQAPREVSPVALGSPSCHDSFS